MAKLTNDTDTRAFLEAERALAQRLDRVPASHPRLHLGPSALEPLRRPALVVWGARDPYIPVEQAHRQGRAFAVTDVVILPDSGHWPFVDDPEAVAAAVLPFLRRSTAPAAPAAPAV